MSAITKKIEPRSMPTSSDDDHAEIVEQAANGSATAFEQLIRGHQEMVRAFLSRYTGCQEATNDLAQEVFVVAFQRLSDFRGSSRFSTWLLGIARHKALNFLRSEIRRRKSERRFFESELAERQLRRLGSADLESEQELMGDLRTCLGELPERSRQLIEAYYFQQQSALSIAASNGQKSGTVRMKLLRIRAVLQKCVSQKSRQRS